MRISSSAHIRTYFIISKSVWTDLQYPNLSSYQLKYCYAQTVKTQLQWYSFLFKILLLLLSFGMNKQVTSLSSPKIHPNLNLQVSFSKSLNSFMASESWTSQSSIASRLMEKSFLYLLSIIKGWNWILATFETQCSFLYPLQDLIRIRKASLLLVEYLTVEK